MMPEALSSYLLEYFPLVIFIGGLISAYSRFRTRQNLFEEASKDKYRALEKQICQESRHTKEYVDLKTDHMLTQIDDIKKSIDQMTSAIDNLCNRVYKIIDRT